MLIREIQLGRMDFQLMAGRYMYSIALLFVLCLLWAITLQLHLSV